MFIINGILIAIFLPEQRPYTIFISLLLALIIYTSNYIKKIREKFEENKGQIINLKKDLNTNNRLIKLEKDVEWLKMKKAQIDFIDVIKFAAIIVLGYIIIQGIISTF